MTIHLAMVGLSDRGRLREKNEDAITFDSEYAYAMVADGMGGHRSGEVASQLAVDTLNSILRQGGGGCECRAGTSLARQSDALEEAVVKANQTIYSLSQAREEHRGMGTTLVLARIYGSRVIVAHVGDSRLYRLRGTRMRRLTRDHSYVEECVQRGEMTRREASESSFANVITRAVGLEASVEVELASFAWRDQDLYLLCSDGLSDLVPERHIKRLLNSPGRALETIANDLVEEANARGGSDNISVVLMRLSRSA